MIASLRPWRTLATRYPIKGSETSSVETASRLYWRENVQLRGPNSSVHTFLFWSVQACSRLRYCSCAGWALTTCYLRASGEPPRRTPHASRPKSELERLRKAVEKIGDRRGCVKADPIGEASLRRVLCAYVTHFHEERIIKARIVCCSFRRVRSHQLTGINQVVVGNVWAVQLHTTIDRSHEYFGPTGAAKRISYLTLCRCRAGLYRPPQY